MRPINIVDGPGFKQLMYEMDPRYKLPTPKTLRNKLIPNLHAKSVGKIIKDLDDVKHCSLTTDGWTSMAGDKYTAYTIHYVNWSAQEPVLKSKILECAPFEAEKADAPAIEQDLTRVVEKYDIKEKLVLTVADNASDVQLA